MRIIDLHMKSPGRWTYHVLSSEEFTYCDVCVKPFKGCRLICKQHDKMVDKKEIQEYIDMMRKTWI